MNNKGYDYLFDKAQKKGRYHMFTIDGKGFKKTIATRSLSKSNINLENYGIILKKKEWGKAFLPSFLIEKGIPANKLVNYLTNINSIISDYLHESTKIMQSVNKQIEKLERKKGRKILHKNDYVVRVNEYYDYSNIPFTNKEGRSCWGILNPCVNNHDSTHFIFELGEISYKQFKEMYINAVTELGIMDTEYYLGEGYYETDSYAECDTKLFREYAVSLIEKRSKKMPSIKARTQKDQKDYLESKSAINKNIINNDVQQDI